MKLSEEKKISYVKVKSHVYTETDDYEWMAIHS